jgi:hypothetical protein
MSAGFYPAWRAEQEGRRAFVRYQGELRRAYRRIAHIVDWGRPIWVAHGDEPNVPYRAAGEEPVPIGVELAIYRFRRQLFRYRPPSPKAGKVGYIVVGQGPGRTDWVPIDGLLPPHIELGEII